ncbi:MAG: polysaccharide biosynthesis tyrosine autokinase [Herpetosiphon sp.]
MVSRRQTPVYQASTTISIQDAPGTNIGSELQSIMLSQQRIQTYARLLVAKPLLQTVGQRLGLPNGVPQRSILVTPVRETQLILISVLDTDPRRAAQIANTLVTTFDEQRRALQSARYAASKQSLQQQMTTLQQQIDQASTGLTALGPVSGTNNASDRLQTMLAQARERYANVLSTFEQVRLAEEQTISTVVQEEPAEAPTVSTGPRVRRNTVLAALMGLLLATGLVFLRERFNDKVGDPAALAEFLDLPLLGVLAHSTAANMHQVVVAAEPRSPMAEAYRGLRTNIEFTGVAQPLRTLLVTSPSANDGKSTVTVNLAAILAQGGRKVVVVDADMRRPTLHNRFGLPNRSGLSELFVQPDPDVYAALCTTPINDVMVVTSGTLPPNPAELLGSEKMIEILDVLRARNDIIIIDSPPVTLVTDPAVLSSCTDGVLLVVRAGKTRLHACALAVEQFRRVGANIIGLVVNDLPTGSAGYGYLGYYQYSADVGQYSSNSGAGAGLRQWLRRKSRRSRPVHDRF